MRNISYWKISQRFVSFLLSSTQWFSSTSSSNIIAKSIYISCGNFRNDRYPSFVRRRHRDWRLQSRHQYIVPKSTYLSYLVICSDLYFPFVVVALSIPIAIFVCFFAFVADVMFFSIVQGGSNHWRSLSRGSCIFFMLLQAISRAHQCPSSSVTKILHWTWAVWHCLVVAVLQQCTSKSWLVCSALLGAAPLQTLALHTVVYEDGSQFYLAASVLVCIALGFHVPVQRGAKNLF